MPIDPPWTELQATEVRQPQRAGQWGVSLLGASQTEAIHGSHPGLPVAVEVDLRPHTIAATPLLGAAQTQADLCR